MSYPFPNLATPDLPSIEMGRRIDTGFRQIFTGHINTNSLVNGGASTITLTPNASSTVITFAPQMVSSTSNLILTPTTANAAAAIATTYVSARSVTNNTITLTHANNAQVDKTFNYTLIG